MSKEPNYFSAFQEERTERRFLIWSFKEKAWWRPDAKGYTKKRAEAGRYTVEEALRHRFTREDENTPKGEGLVLDES